MQTCILTEPQGETAWLVMEKLLLRGMRLYALAAPSPRLDALAARFPEQLERIDPKADPAALEGVHADMLVIDASSPPEEDFAVLEEGKDIDSAVSCYRKAAGPLRLAAGLLPLAAGPHPGRICWITGAQAAGGYCEEMRRTALHMGIKLLFNALRPQGYTFRLVCQAPQGEENGYAAEYFLRARAGGDEERLTLHNHLGVELPW
ncbi:MAG: hypothetical protein HFG26_07075 [Provencibacterium sp.]|nr:hypothetical protein [Provencibacterium sp.]